MNWRSLAISLGLILLGAVVFSLWAADPPKLSAPADTSITPSPAPTPAAVVQAPQKPPPIAAAPPAPAPPDPTFAPAPADDLPTDEPPNFAMAPSGLSDQDVEPLDGGVLHPLSREGIKEAVQQELPQLRECYDAWLRQNPALAGKIKMQLIISEIAGFDRGRVARVHIAADAGVGHLVMEGCVRNVFGAMRFERPARGELRVTYPLTFESTK